MSEQKHTLGPWYAYPFSLKVADKKFWFDENGARHGDTPNMVIDCESVADTYLIAAAPDLLEQAEVLVEKLKSMAIHESHYAPLEAAIAKATGGSA